MDKDAVLKKAKTLRDDYAEAKRIARFVGNPLPEPPAELAELDA